MSRYTLTCPQCHAENSLSARRLLLRVDEGTSTTGEVLFTCLSCHTTASVELDPAAVAVLVLGGVTHLSVSAPVVEHPETVPAGPAFTHDDLLDLHHQLDCDDSWFEQLVGEDC
jgi:hypothetical protein